MRPDLIGGRRLGPLLTHSQFLTQDSAAHPRRIRAHPVSCPAASLVCAGRNQKDLTVDQPSIIVGSGRIGTLLAQLGQRRGYDDLIIRRGDPIPADHPGPIYLCTRNDDLSAVVAQCPEEKRPDLVFLQNGMSGRHASSAAPAACVLERADWPRAQSNGGPILNP